MLYHSISGMKAFDISTVAVGIAWTTPFGKRVEQLQQLHLNIAPYIGLGNVSANFSKLDSNYYIDQKSQGVAFAAGITVGVIYDLREYGEVEFGYRYEGNWFGVTTKYGYYEESSNVSLGHSGFSLGYNYKF